MCGEEEKNLEVLEWLLSKTDDHAPLTEGPEGKGYTPLHIASKLGHSKIVSKIFEKSTSLINKNPPDQTNEKNTLLHLASGLGLDSKASLESEGSYVEVVKTLLEKIDVPTDDIRDTLVNGDQETPLHLAAKMGSKAVCVELIKWKDHDKLQVLDLEHKNKDGNTPLHLASENNHIEVVKFLMENGARVESRNKVNDLAVHKAATKGKLEVVKYFASIDDKAGLLNCQGNKQHQSPLHKATLSGHSKVVEILTSKYSVKINIKDKSGNTPLHIACEKGYREIVKILIDQKADITIKNINGNLPLHLACKFNSYNHRILIEDLMKKNRELKLNHPNEENEDGETPLQIADYLRDNVEILNC